MRKVMNLLHGIGRAAHRPVAELEPMCAEHRRGHVRVGGHLFLRISISACCNQERMSISRYIVIAVARCSFDTCSKPALVCSLARKKLQWATSGRRPNSVPRRRIELPLRSSVQPQFLCLGLIQFLQRFLHWQDAVHRAAPDGLDREDVLQCSRNCPSLALDLSWA